MLITAADRAELLPMSRRVKNLIGQRFGKLTVESRAPNTPGGSTRWNCRCECGSTRVVSGGHLASGHTQSCSCIKGKANATHRMRGTPTHNTWCAMKQRCNYTKSDAYPEYGGRGIKVCQRWNDSFEAFLADMGPRPDGMTIEREDTNGHYEPGNCRWATMLEQNRNRRSNINIERDGRTMCVKDWCVELGLDPDKVYGRIRRGTTPREALRA